MPLISKSSDLEQNSSIKHFTWQEIINFSAVKRYPASFRQGGSGDWKQSSEGADGYFLITVDGEPYWSDAVGQVPFAVNQYRLDRGNIDRVIELGRRFGDGSLLGGLFGETEPGNGYDIYFVLRGALYAKDRYSYQSKQTSRGVRWTETDNGNFNSAPLSTPINRQNATNYGVR